MVPPADYPSRSGREGWRFHKSDVVPSPSRLPPAVSDEAPLHRSITGGAAAASKWEPLRTASRAVLGALIALAFLWTPSARQPLKLRYFKTKEFQVIYLEERNEYVLPHLAGCFANSFRFYRRFFDYTPSEPVTIILQDFDDYGYAGATAMPLDYLVLGIEPFEYVYETSPTNERINWVMSHELLHVVASDKAAARDRRFRRLFGGKVQAVPEQPESMLYSYLTTPRLYAPRWYHEGMAVFMETWLSGGYGRALGGYDEMVFRTMVHDDAYFYDTVGLESEGKAIDFQVGQVSYLYGTRFVSYLAYLYGPEKVMAWLNRTEDSKASYREQFKHVFGNDLDSEWQKWIAWEHEWQKANLDEVRKYPVTEFKALSKRPLGSVSRAYFDPERRSLYTAVNYPGDFSHVVAIDIDTWKIRPICEVATPALYYVTSLAYDPDSRTIFFTTHNSSQWRTLNKVDIDSGKTTVLIKDLRTGDLAFDRADKSLWGVRHDNGISTLVKILPPYDSFDDVRPVWTLPYGKDLFDIDISPDGTSITGSIIEVTGRQRLVRMSIRELEAGIEGYETLYEFADNSPANFVYSPDGKYLFGTSYYTGVSNIFRYDFAAKQMDTLTNGLTGFFRPVPISEESLIAFNYTAKGFVPVLLANRKIEDVNPIRFLGQAIVEKYPVVKSWTLGSPAAIDLEAMHAERGIYKPLDNLQPISAYPVLQSYRGATCLGMRADIWDVAGVDRADITASVSPQEGVSSDERLHLLVNYRHWGWLFTAAANRADFYDFFGPTLTSRKGYSLAAQYSRALIDDKPSHLDYTVRAAGYTGLDTLPEYQNIATSASRYVALSGRLGYRRDRKSIGGLEAEKGFEWELDGLDNFVSGRHFPRLWASAAEGFYLPLEHSSLWLHEGVGKSWGDREQTISNFYFGAFGNNYVDHGEVERYRDYSSFPGIDIDEAGGTTFGKAMLEWRLPPIRFRRFGFPQFYCTWASTNLFVGGLSVNFDDASLRRTLYNYGAQMDFKVVAFTNLSFTLSVGYARAHDPYLGWSDEIMISLKVL